MKPYTLAWWMRMLELTTGGLINSLRDGNMKAYDKYYDLWFWIRERIIKKYGEDA